MPEAKTIRDTAKPQDDAAERACAQEYQEQAAGLAVNFQRQCSLAALDSLLAAANSPADGLDKARTAARTALLQTRTLAAEVERFVTSVPADSTPARLEGDAPRHAITGTEGQAR